MSIYINQDSQIMIQGITGSAGQTHAQLMLDYGAKVVGGTSPGKAGQKVLGLPIFDTVVDCVKETGANVSVIFVPAPFAADAILEAADAGIEVVVCITEHIPVLDMVQVKRYLADKDTILVGPNSPGLVTAGESKVGIMPNFIHQPGHVGVISRSGTLTYEAIDQLTRKGIGQSTAIGIGGDPVKGVNFIEVLQAFEADPETKAVLMIGEIGGNDEEKAAEYIESQMTKPVVAFIGGQTAPPGKRMGHAGAIISGGKGTAAEKIKVLNQHGIETAETLAHIGDLVEEVLAKHDLLATCQTKAE